jgi:hypothetical protein
MTIERWDPVGEMLTLREALIEQERGDVDGMV